MTKDDLQKVRDALAALFPATSHMADTRYEAIRILDAALAAPEPQPVGYIVQNGNGVVFQEVIAEDSKRLTRDGKTVWTPLYTAPVAAQREWVGLTDAEHEDIFNRIYSGKSEYLKAIEAALRAKNEEKNHG